MRWVALALAGLALVSCGGEGSKDAPRGVDDEGPADVLLFPDGFSNVAHKCDGPNMVYSSTNGGSGNEGSNRAAIAVVPNDPRCAPRKPQ
jgi:hypothetical protein